MSSPPKPLTRADLDRVTCDKPGCDHTAHDGLYLHSHCHPETPTWSYYSGVAGTIRIECAECGHVIVNIAVAPGLITNENEPAFGYQACWAEQDHRYCRKRIGHDGPHAYI
jgi:hypothetical protein